MGVARTRMVNETGSQSRLGLGGSDENNGHSSSPQRLHSSWGDQMNTGEMHAKQHNCDECNVESMNCRGLAV